MRAVRTLDWYAPRPSVDPRVNLRSVDCAKKVGDSVTAKRGGWEGLLKCGGGLSYGHADLGHVGAHYRDESVLVGPDTGTDNGLLEVRNGDFA